MQILLADQRNTQSNFSLTYNGWKKIIRMCSWSNGDILIRMKIDDLKANITDVTKSADCVVELTVVLFRQTWLFKEDFVCVRWRKAAVMMFLLTFKSYRIKLLRAHFKPWGGLQLQMGVSALTEIFFSKIVKW